MGLLTEPRRYTTTQQVNNKIDTNSRNLKYVPPSLTSVLLCICVILFFLSSPSPQILCCSGLLQNCPTNNWYGFDDVRSRGRNNDFQINSSSSSFDYSSTNSKSKLEEDGGVAYRQSVCTPQEIKLIQKARAICHYNKNLRKRATATINDAFLILYDDCKQGTLLRFSNTID